MSKENIEPIYEDTFQKQPGKFKKRPFLIGIVVLILIGVGYGLFRNHESKVNSYAVRGAAISQDDGYVDFQSLDAGGLKFVYLKATTGSTYKDDDFSDNYARSQGAGLKVGIYHEFSFSTSAEEQYRYLVSQVGSSTGNLPIAIHVYYYGNYLKNEPNADEQGHKLAKLIRLLANHYQQGCVVWATPSVQARLVSPYINQTKRIVTTNKLNYSASDTLFVAYSGNDKLVINHKDSDLLPMVYSGRKSTFDSAY